MVDLDLYFIYMNKLGGTVHNDDRLKHIVSVGYEIECGVLAKMTLSELNDGENKLLLNTDTTSKDVAQLKKLEEDLEDLDDHILKRMEETVEMDAFDKNGKVDPHTEFHITNDYAVTPFLKKLKSMCSYASDNSESEESNIEDKNQMYKFHAKNGDVYDINFFDECI
jgi:hypothetical protein